MSAPFPELSRISVGKGRCSRSSANGDMLKESPLSHTLWVDCRVRSDLSLNTKQRMLTILTCFECSTIKRVCGLFITTLLCYYIFLIVILELAGY